MEKGTASWIRDPKIEHQKKSSLPARAEHSSLPAAPQAKQLSPAALLQACPSPQAGSTGADKPSVPSARPEGPVVQSPARPRRLLPPTNTPSSFRVPPRGTPGASGSSGPRKAGERQAGIISHACSWHRVLGTSQRRAGRPHLSTLPCHSSSPCSSNPAFSSREGTLLEAAPGSHMFGKKKKQEKKSSSQHPPACRGNIAACVPVRTEAEGTWDLLPRCRRFGHRLCSLGADLTLCIDGCV